MSVVCDETKTRHRLQCALCNSGFLGLRRSSRTRAAKNCLMIWAITFVGLHCVVRGGLRLSAIG